MNPASPSPTYLHGHAEPVLRSHRSRTAANSAGYLLPQLRSGQRLLDVGCGPGTITADLARIVGAAGVTALDSSPQAVGQARAALAEAGQDEADVRVADLFTADLPDGSFDVVHAHQVLQHVVDPVAALARMRALCSPGGVVAARDADYAAMTWYPLVPGLDDWLALYRTLARHAGGEPDAGRRLLAWAQAAGFTEVTASASTWCYAGPEPTGWWGGLWADRILHSSIAEHAVSSGEATRADLERISQAWRAWAGSKEAWFVVVHGEILCRG